MSLCDRSALKSLGAAALAALFCGAAVQADIPDDAARADVVFLGEIHDNPAHHSVQAEWVAALTPAALVFEMIEPARARVLSPDMMQDADALEAALDWAASGWPDFDMYAPIFAAAPTARVFGAAVPRQAARAALETGAALAFGVDDAARFGLNTPLPEAQQSARETLQHDAHCGALPGEMLPGMVAIQRLRDAELARAALAAWTETGGPVVVITGNGHARTDWGAPVALSRAAPDLALFSLGQTEAGQIAGTFDALRDADAVARPDPCAAFGVTE